MQLNYFTVSHDTIFLFGSSGDIKLSFGAKVDFSGWVLYSTMWIFLVIGKFAFSLGSEETLKEANLALICS